tara:strand:+ start:187 stop:447 length:261 start_codon:yes stop_codon:yes gene_type:complete
MSSEVRQYIIEDAAKKSEIFSAQLLNLPIKKKLLELKVSDQNECKFWKLYDKTSIHEDGDQLKAVTGICLVLIVFSFIGLYSSLLS